MGLKGYMLLRDRKYLDFFCDVVLWFLLLMGLILIFIPSSMFRSISQMDLNLSPAVIQVGKWMAIIGAVGILFMSGRDKKNSRIMIGR
jgi:V/A-type H+-transporting ATPase subunit I